MKYDLACGDNKAGEEWIGIDIVDGADVDVVADLRQGVPFDHELVEKDSAVHVRVRHFLEHMDRDEVEQFLLDVQRLCKPGALLEVITPYYLSDDAVAGDHKSFYSEKSFKCYQINHGFPTPKPQFLELEDVELVWSTQKWVRLMRLVLPDIVAKNVPNAVQDIRFKLRVVKK